MWSPQLYFYKGKENNRSDELLEKSIEQIKEISWQGNNLPSILSLNHLADRAKVSYYYLRDVVSRNRKFYRQFYIHKKTGGRRLISVPEPGLLYVQRWINKHILQQIASHQDSFAFAKNSSIRNCAIRHTGAQWLIKMDITGFFESISEIQVYRVFRDIGYKPLVAFELTRICTINSGPTGTKKNYPNWEIREREHKIYDYMNRTQIIGCLPQGAPTSPMLSNIAMKNIDCIIAKLSKEYNLTYTRYSDDLTFSTRNKKFTRGQAKEFIKEISKILKKSGFHPQHRKTKVISPGSRKIVLGLQVDGTCLKLRKEFKNNIRLHLYYLKKLGIQKHMQNRKFNTVSGMKAHIGGLINYAILIEPEYGKMVKKEFKSIDWPF